MALQNSDRIEPCLFAPILSRLQFITMKLSLSFSDCVSSPSNFPEVIPHSDKILGRLLPSLLPHLLFLPSLFFLSRDSVSGRHLAPSSFKPDLGKPSNLLSFHKMVCFPGKDHPSVTYLAYFFMSLLSVPVSQECRGGSSALFSLPPPMSEVLRGIGQRKKVLAWRLQNRKGSFPSHLVGPQVIGMYHPNSVRGVGVTSRSAAFMSDLYWFWRWEQVPPNYL